MPTQQNESAESPHGHHRTSRIRLTDGTVRDLSCPPGKKDVLVFDDALKGFGVRVLPDRADGRRRRIFLMQYRRGAKVRRIVIGEWGAELTAAKARIKAEVLRGEVRANRDPVSERRAEVAAARLAEAERTRAAQETAFTFDLLLKAWEADYLVARRPSYRIDALARIRTSLASLLDRPTSAISRTEAARALQTAGQSRGRVGANRVMAYARACFGWGVRAGLVASNPFAGLPQLADEVARDRVLSRDEIGAAWRATEGLENPYRAFVRTLLLTLQRRQEVAGAMWGEIDLDAGHWTIPAARAKNARQHVVHLTDTLLVELRGLARPTKGDLVFGLPSGKPITAFSAIKRFIDAAMAAEHAERAEVVGRIDPHGCGWTFHDFRRTGVSQLAGLGFQPHVVDRLLNHVQGAIQGVAAVYQRAEFLTERKAALETWSRFVTEAAGRIDTSTNVVPLTRRA